MKIIIKCVAVYFSVILVLWMACSIQTVSLNPRDWGGEERGFFGVISFIAFLVCIFAALEITFGSKKVDKAD